MNNIVNMTGNSVISGILDQQVFKKAIKVIRKDFLFFDDVSIIVYEKHELEEQGEKIPDWAVATKKGTKIVIFKKILNYNMSYLQEILIHEFAHIAMDNAVEDGVPLYLYEGVAMYYANQNQYTALDVNLLLSKFDNLNYETDDFYAVSYSLVSLFIEQLSLQRLLVLINSHNWIEIEKEIKKIMEKKCV